MKKVGIIILNFNGLKDTLECLKSLQGIKEDGFVTNTYVVDYSHNPKEADQIKRQYSSVNLITKKNNLGFAGGNNVGIKQALSDGCEFILLLNNDTYISSDFLIKLYQYLEQNPQIGAVSPKIYFAKDFEFHKDRYQEKDLGKVIWYGGGKIDWNNMYCSHRGVDEVDRGQFEETIETDFISGCCVLIRKKTLDQVGLLAEKLFMYWEDTDWSLRAKKLDWKLMIFPQASIWHKNAGSSSSGSNLQDYFLTRNRLWTGMKYASWRTKLALTRQSLIQLFNGRKWEKIGVRDFWLGRMGKGSWE